MTTKTLNANDGTLDTFLQRRMEETHGTDWDADDAGGLFGILFSDGDEFTEAEAEAKFQEAVVYYRNRATERLAASYLELLKQHLTPEERTEVRTGRKVPNDFCDANMFLLDAWTAAMGTDAFGPDDQGISEETLQMMNRAMEIAHPQT